MQTDRKKKLVLVGISRSGERGFHFHSIEEERSSSFDLKIPLSCAKTTEKDYSKRVERSAG